MTILSAALKAPFGVIDMGSNGIRFGIVAALARHLPVAYEERAPISLLDAQRETNSIPAETIDQVVTSFLRFQQICRDEGVDPANVKVIATEATRIATNSKEFLAKIFEATGWTVTILSKEQEALVSSMGIVASFYKVDGLTMDLGGGSVELSYVSSTAAPTNSSLSPDEGDAERDIDNRPRKRLKTTISEASARPVSLPYGAAVMRNRLAACKNQKNKRLALFNEIVEEVRKARSTAAISNQRNNVDGYTLYMSGGGFRALGYLSMAMFSFPEVSSDESAANSDDSRLNKNNLKYPIPIISGYSISGEQLERLADTFKGRDPDELVNELKVFRISKRRTKMIPATCFLVSAIIKVIKVKRVYFSEGGVRQGICFDMLDPIEQSKDPLLEGLKAYATQYSQCLSSSEYNTVLQVLKDAIPPLYLMPDHPLQLHRLVPAAVHLANLSTHYPKETRAFIAFGMPLAGGPLANIPGLLHLERAILALILAYRQGGDVPDPSFHAIENMIGKHGVAVCKYVGKLMELIFLISPCRPGLGFVKSGVKLRLADNPSSDDESFSSCESTTSSPLSSPVSPTQQTYYCQAKLEVLLPKKSNPIVEAPAVISVIEGLDRKIQVKQFDLDDEVQSLEKSKLFSVKIIRS